MINAFMRIDKLIFLLLVIYSLSFHIITINRIYRYCSWFKNKFNIIYI